MALNLDEKRAARREKNREENSETPELIFGGKTYELPFEMPADAITGLNDFARANSEKDKNKRSSETIIGALRETLRALLGARFDEFWAERPSIDDLAEVVVGIPEEYGLSLGESEASATSSKSTSTPPRQRSKRSTN